RCIEPRTALRRIHGVGRPAPRPPTRTAAASTASAPTTAAWTATPATDARVDSEAVASVAVHREAVGHAVHNRTRLVDDLRPQQRADDARGRGAVDGHAVREAVLHGEICARRRADEDAALLDERLQMLEALPREARPNVV